MHRKILSFTEHDQLWNPDFREQPEQHALRTLLFLNELFAEESATFISITSHSGSINAFLRIVGHRDVSVPPGGLVPVFVSAPGASLATATTDHLVSHPAVDAITVPRFRDA
jgi:hypothetical protein